jgi:D-amino-acid oxidase
VRSAGADLRVRSFATLDEALAECPRVVNCAGLGARELVPDPTLVAVRGQVVRVTNPGISRVTVDEYSGHGITYVVPRSRDVVLGGTADEGQEDTTPDPVVTREIIARCARLEPTLARAEVVSVAVGLRPVRPTVRLEREARTGGTVVHNYGHGGAGVTLSWGCAEAAAHLLLGT